MVSHKEFEEAVYAHLLELLKVHPDWYFAMRTKASKGYETNRFIGAEDSKYLGTTFWKIKGPFSGPAYKLGVYFTYTDRTYSYYLEGRHSRKYDDKQSQSTLALINSFLKESKYFSGRASGRDPDKNNESVVVPAPGVDSYFHLEELFEDLDRDLAEFIPFIDGKIATLTQVYPEYRANRISAVDFEKYQRAYDRRLAKLAKNEEDKALHEAGLRYQQMQDEIGREIMESFGPRLNPSPLNQILYGPPGTGKTYSTITQAVAIVEKKRLDTVTNEDRQEVLRRFRNYQEGGRIAYTTFHQSLSYEDFVEGLKPVLGDEDETDDGQVRYTIRRGVFRNVCDAALRSILGKRPSQSTRTVLDFDRKYELLADLVKNQLLETGAYKLESRNGGTVLVDDISTQGNFRIKHENGSRIYTVGKERLTRLHLGLLERGDEVSNIHDTFRDIIGGSNSSAYWAVLNAVRMFEQEHTTREVEVETTPSKDALATLTREDYRQSDLDRHVLIIDEINRGNVSAILGELITLLEPNKRLGAKEELKVTLPYSRDTFGVPPNLHIIGTMNTADRSVEALDAALRRRFVFREVKPDPGVIRTVLGEKVTIRVSDELTVNLADLLDLLNQRIAVLRNTDHQLGHSYFLDVSDWQELRDVLVDRIVPLLREYFFADLSQLQLVVGNGFRQRVAARATQFGTADDTDALEVDNLYTYTFPSPAGREELTEFIAAMNYPA